MQQLIWFSIPGAFAVTAIWLTVSDVRKWPDAVLIAAAIGFGFILHQLFRTFFEMFGGWESRYRPVVKAILNHFPDLAQPREAFLIWEITFYSDDMPEAFRSHDRGAWHYIMSFWSSSFTAVLAALWFASVSIVKSGNSHWGWFATMIGVALLFFVKGALTYRSLGHQECLIFHKLTEAFDKTHAAVRSSRQIHRRPVGHEHRPQLPRDVHDEV